MIFLILSIFFFGLSSLLSFCFRGENLRKLFACGGVFAASLIGLIPAVSVLAGSGNLESLNLAIGLDPLSAFFLLPILGLSALVAPYAWGYLKGQPQLLATLPFFPLLVFSMMGVVIARDGFLFIIVWEIMSLASFFLVTAEHQHREVRHAGWIYLAATHLATAFLLVFFILLYKESGSFAFNSFIALPQLKWAGFLFVCALIGFGTKAGIFPFHFWLPHAHPAAPSYISALMSGVMIKTGIYGIFRALTFLKAPPWWCGELLIILGIVSAVLGILYALVQHDLKKLLAYSSVENIGIIVAGIGLGLVGQWRQNPTAQFLGFGGALLHVFNHAIFKGLLFLGAGNILHTTHTKRLDQLGGLIRKMPRTAAPFLVASAAICALPPLNGFVGEWFLYLGFLEGVKTFSHSPFFMCVLAVVGIAFAGGLAVACFAKVFGIVFLGAPRTEIEAVVEKESWQQWLPLGILAFLCLLFGFLPQIILPSLSNLLMDIGFITSPAIENPLLNFKIFNLIFIILLGIFLFAWLARRRLFSSKTKKIGPTWGCGFDRPAFRMQYSAASFAEPVAAFFNFLLRPLIHFKKPEGFFPVQSHYEEEREDLAERLLVNPPIQKISGILLWIRKKQRSRVQNYLAYIFVTLLLLLLWEVWIGI